VSDATLTAETSPALRVAEDGVLEAAMTIGGKPVSGQAFVEARNPANLDEVVGRFPQGTVADADQAIAAAKEAFQTWREVPVAERAERLAAAGDALQRRVGEWQELFTRENGKVQLESGADLQMCGAVLEYYAAHPEFLEPRVDADMRGELRVLKKPLGVCAAIVPWNWPAVLSGLKIGPALLAGNTLVLKGPDYSSITMLAALGAIAEHFPPGVLNVLSGQGPDVGRALVASTDVAKVALTGGTATGRAVAADAAGTLKRVTLELGGNDAAILMPDVVLDESVVGNLVLGAFMSTGQICFAIKRLFVHRSRYEELLTKMRAELESMTVGDPVDFTVRMGPLNNAAQYERVTALIERTKAAGLDVEEHGVYQDGLDPEQGHFVRPHLVLDPPDDTEIVQTEPFGPILPILVYDDVDEAIERANATPFGLASSVWTPDPQAGLEIGARLNAGTTFVNGHTVFMVDLSAPFGGIGSSGYGRELGPEGIDEYVFLQSVTNKQV
jgi:acyl-CoA reductase-like NAD-dependent aldehyde dehydrogenase